jgi:hypothetical protein
MKRIFLALSFLAFSSLAQAQENIKFNTTQECSEFASAVLQKYDPEGRLRRVGISSSYLMKNGMMIDDKFVIVDCLQSNAKIWTKEQHYKNVEQSQRREMIRQQQEKIQQQELLKKYNL